MVRGIPPTSAFADSMPTFHSDGTTIAYLDEGEGPPVLLIHGFASSARVNWVDPGWVAALNRAGHRVVAFDNRGHGASGKLYDPAAYHLPIMAEDARQLLDHLGIARAAVLGYSMGARITALLAIRHPARVSAAVLGGIGYGLVKGFGDGEEIAAALEAPSLDDVVGERGRMFRRFAERTKSDLFALAACMRGSRLALPVDEVAGISVPVLVAVGTRDEVAGDPRPLVELIPDAEYLAIPDRDHMTGVGDRVFKAAAIDFLARHARGG
jgi:pimeloyl-ACP methyl ester carboxylesterase